MKRLNQRSLDRQLVKKIFSSHMTEILVKISLDRVEHTINKLNINGREVEVLQTT